MSMPLLPLLISVAMGPSSPAVDDLARKFVEQESGVGMVLGFVRTDSTWVRGYGRVALDEDREPDGDTIFDIGALTGHITGMLAFEAMHWGSMSLDHPIYRYFRPTVTLPGGRQRPILLGDLVRGTSGLPVMPPSLHDPTSPAMWSVYGEADLFHDLATVELDFEPGSRADFSLLATATLGYCVTRAAVLEFEELVRDRITSRLGMASTGYRLPDPAMARLAPGHDAQGQLRPRVRPTALQPCTGLLSSGHDMVRLVQALMRADDSPWIEMCHYWWTVLGEPLGIRARDWDDFPADFVHGRAHLGLGYASALWLAPRRGLALIVLANASKPQIEDVAAEVFEAWLEETR